MNNFLVFCIHEISRKLYYYKIVNLLLFFSWTLDEWK